MEITPEKLMQQLKSAQPLLCNVLLLFGEEAYYRNLISKLLEKYVFADLDEADREITVFEKDTKIKEVANIINTYPFFGGKSLVVIKDEKLFNNKAGEEDGNEKITELLELMKDVPEYCQLVLNISSIDKRSKLYKSCKKDALVCECQSFKVNMADSWLRQQAESYDAQFEQEAVELIKEYLAPVDKVPLQLLQQEIEKLSVYAGERKLWTAQDVKLIFTALPEVSSFSLTNAICSKKLHEVLELLAYEKKKGTNLLKLCGLITFSIRRLLVVKEMLQKGYSAPQIAAEKGWHPYVVNIAGRQAKNFSALALQQFLIDIAEMNSKIRQGGRQYDLLEEILIKLIS